MYPLTVPDAWIKVASEWHDGQTSGLYSLASTGKIHGWDHVCLLRRELGKVIRMVEPTHNTYPEKVLWTGLNQLYGAVFLLWTNEIGLISE